MDGRRALLFEFQADFTVEYLVFPDDAEAEAFWVSPEWGPDDVNALFRGPVVGAILRERGCLVLHAGAIVVDGRAIAFLGPSGSGKSTTLATMTQLTHPLLCDDMALLEETEFGQFNILAGSNLLKLWPDAVQALSLDPAQLARVHALTEKRVLQCAGTERSIALPVGALVLMGGSGVDPAGDFCRLDPVDALMALMGQYYPPFLPLTHNERVTWFDRLGRLVARVPVYRVHRPRGFEDLPAFCARLAALGRAEP